MLAQACDAFVRLHGALLPLETERLGDDGYGERADLLGDLRDHRRGSRSRAAAHACGHEHEVSAAEQVVQVLTGLLCRFAPQLGVAAHAESPGEPVADAHLPRNVQPDQVLSVRVDCDVFDARNALLVHPPHRVGAAAAHADHLDARHAKRLAEAQRYLAGRVIVCLGPQLVRVQLRLGFIRICAPDEHLPALQAGASGAPTEGEGTSDGLRRPTSNMRMSS